MKQLFILVLVSLFTQIGLSQSTTNASILLKDSNGQQVAVQSLENNGKAKVFVFWSNYCAKCKLQMKGMRNIGKNWFEDYNAEIYFVSIENFEGQPYKKLDFLNEFLQEDGVFAYHDQNMNFYNSQSFFAIPSTLLIDKDGNIVNQWTGYDDGLERSVGMYFKKLAEK